MGDTRFRTTPAMPLSGRKSRMPFTTAAAVRARPRPSSTSTAGVRVARARSQALASALRPMPS